MSTIGQILTAARDRAGYSIAELSSRTCIRESVLRGMERDDFGPCGGDFYARGHIKAVCRELSVDPVELLGRYDAEYAAQPAPPAEVDDSEQIVAAARAGLGGAAQRGADSRHRRSRGPFRGPRNPPPDAGSASDADGSGDDGGHGGGSASGGAAGGSSTVMVGFDGDANTAGGSGEAAEVPPQGRGQQGEAPPQSGERAETGEGTEGRESAARSESSAPRGEMSGASVQSRRARLGLDGEAEWADALDRPAEAFHAPQHARPERRAQRVPDTVISYDRMHCMSEQPSAPPQSPAPLREPRSPEPWSPEDVDTAPNDSFAGAAGRRPTGRRRRRDRPFMVALGFVRVPEGWPCSPLYAGADETEHVYRITAGEWTAAALRRYWPLGIAACLVVAGVAAGVRAWPGEAADPGRVEAGQAGAGPERAEEDAPGRDLGRDRASEPPADEDRSAEQVHELTALAQIQEGVSTTFRGEQRPEELRVKMYATERTWLSVTDAEGETVFTGVMDKGDTRRWSDPEALRFHLGDGGTLYMTVNGDERGQAGRSGEITHMTVDADDLAS